MSADLFLNNLSVEQQEKIIQDLTIHKGYAFIDDAFGEEFCTFLKEEILSLADQDFFSDSVNILTALSEEGEIERLETVKPNILELDVIVDEEVFCKPQILWMAETLNEFIESGVNHVKDTLNEKFPFLQLKALDQLKLQVNNGDGGCFHMHYDTRTDNSKRHLTVLLYLNEDWVPGNGGELRVCPMPGQTEDIDPLFDRVVMFCSHNLLHRTLPAIEQRVVLSLWFSSETDEPFPFIEEDEDEISTVVKSSVHETRAVSKVLFRDEWAQSLYDAFEDKDIVEKAVNLHNREVEKVIEILGGEPMVERLKAWCNKQV
eukprot:TRINITY_DN1245_c0_g1_i1.p1 TRINITY_DN1245_c0_g1~~TRINITY_DN1245_c0_g1_i1.p1  ORF type:complete len:317 (-),score=70.70 TRINITY_DN1245_c0_g1_i1:32-982(-)